MISVVIVTHNSRRHIEACLDSVFRQDVDGREVFVIDNGSTDGTKDLLKDRYRQLRLIENQHNMGVCEARNQGIELARGEWVLTLDSDIVLGDGFLKEFVMLSKKLFDRIGMIQSNILGIDGETVYSQGILLTPIRRFYDLNQGKLRATVGNGSSNIIGPCAAAAFYRRSMLQQLKEESGYFDRRFFFLVEDVDLAWRASRAGWKVLFAPRMECRHAGNGSGTDRALRQYLCFRNRRLMIRKNESLWGRILVSVISFPYELARVMVMMFSNKYIWGQGSLGSLR